ncbi:DUF6585 family protein [Nocardia asteroides]|uniref:DUF6585 family protein n=1 Tax=Nocardia asteroides TaxID=1824 RepID=UPI0037CCABB9
MNWTEVGAEPEDIQRAAAKAGLGTRFIEFHAETSRFALTLIKCAGALVLTVAMAATAIGSRHDVLSVLFLLTATIAISGAVKTFLYARALPSVGDRILIFDAGLIRHRRSGHQVFAWANTEVLRDITRHLNAPGGSTLWSETKYTLRRSDGTELVVNHDMYWKITELGTAVETAITTTQLPIAAEKVNRGEAVDFGYFRVDLDGITAGKNFLAWHDIAAIHLADGEVGVQQRRLGRTKKRPISGVPNVNVFAALTQTMLIASRG